MNIVNDIILSLGSNVGDREKNLSLAIELLESSSIVRNISSSSIYETEPIGELNQGLFLNLCIVCKSDHNITELIALVKSIEHYVGRQIRERWHEREIDIDIIFFGDLVMKTSNIVIPHERMHERKFVLVPLVEINPYKIHPLMLKSVRQLLDECHDSSKISLYKSAN